MKINFQELKDIQGIFGQLSKKELPFKTSYKIMKLLTNIDNEMIFYNDSFKKLINEYAEKDENNEVILTEDGENIKLQKDKLEEFSAKYTELSEMEIEILDSSFTLEELEMLTLSPQDLYIIKDFIQE